MTARRPLKSRDTRLAARAASILVTRGVTPNAISMASIGFALMAGAAFWAAGGGGSAYYVAAALGCQLRLLCNLLDGMVAVDAGTGTPNGPYRNEAPARLADKMTLAGMGLPVGPAALGSATASMAVPVPALTELGTAQ